MTNPISQVPAAAVALLQSVASDAEQHVTNKLNELRPRIQSGQLTPGDALLNLERAAEAYPARVAVAQGSAAAGVTQQQARQTARRAARRAVEQAAQVLRTARDTQQQTTGRAAEQRIAGLLDPVATALGPTSQQTHTVLPAYTQYLTATAGAALGGTIAKQIQANTSLGVLIGAVTGFLLGRKVAMGWRA